jgi:mRNA interferase RelE/StbE
MSGVMYELLLSRSAARFYEKADAQLARRLNRCFEQLMQNPYEHPNIKRLSGPLSGYYRYRLGDWRIVFQVDEAGNTIIVAIIAHRSQAYRP